MIKEKLIAYRFATIVYGRPLSINDQDCNVPQPAEVVEDIHFDRAVGPERICLSIYQAQLNEVYKIASPIIENIYGIRTSTDLHIRSLLPGMITQASHLMREWQNNLPPYLALDKMNDISPTCSTAEKMHSLQALSLQLTYDNLMIIIHRPLLADQRASLTRFRERAQGQARPSEVPPELHFPTCYEDSNFKECLDSALRVSRVQNKPELVKLAAQTHLVAFLGMNLFTSSVVMSVCALSDPLSDTAQEAKRGITRTLLVQKSLSQRTSLSMQSSVILEDIVQLILEREREEMLRSAQSGVQHPQLSKLQQTHDQSLHGTPTSVFGSDMGTSPDSYHAQMGGGNAVNVDSGDQVLNNSLISLQRSESNTLHLLFLALRTRHAFDTVEVILFSILIVSLQSSKKVHTPGRGSPANTIIVTTTRSCHQTWLVMPGATSAKTPCETTTSTRRGWKTLGRPGYGTWSHSVRWSEKAWLLTHRLRPPKVLILQLLRAWILQKPSLYKSFMFDLDCMQHLQPLICSCVDDPRS